MARNKSPQVTNGNDSSLPDTDGPQHASARRRKKVKPRMGGLQALPKPVVPDHARAHGHADDLDDKCSQITVVYTDDPPDWRRTFGALALASAHDVLVRRTDILADAVESSEAGWVEAFTRAADTIYQHELRELEALEIVPAHDNFFEKRKKAWELAANQAIDWLGERTGTISPLVEDAIRKAISMWSVDRIEESRKLLQEHFKSNRQAKKLVSVTAPEVSHDDRLETRRAVDGTNVGRLSPSVVSRPAARKVQQYIETHDGQAVFARKAGISEKTLYKFRTTGKVKRNIFRDIASAMGTTPDELLKAQ